MSCILAAFGAYKVSAGIKCEIRWVSFFFCISWTAKALFCFTLGHIRVCVYRANPNAFRSLSAHRQAFREPGKTNIANSYGVCLRKCVLWLFKYIYLSIFIYLTYLTVLTVYDFLALIAFEQIMKLVRSRQYQELYGSDPFRPRLNMVHVSPKVDKSMPKWWQAENSEPISDINYGQDEAHKHFQSQELLAEVLLRNAINLDYAHRKGF